MTFTEITLTKDTPTYPESSFITSRQTHTFIIKLTAHVTSRRRHPHSVSLKAVGNPEGGKMLRATLQTYRITSLGNGDLSRTPSVTGSYDNCFTQRAKEAPRTTSHDPGKSQFAAKAE